MKKMLILALCVVFVPTLFANVDKHIQPVPELYTQGHGTWQGTLSRADTLWAQYPIAPQGCACQLDSVYPFEAWFIDDVTPPTDDYQVDSVVAWFNNWNGFTNWTFVPNIHFQVYLDSGLATPYPQMMPVVDAIVEQANYTATDLGGNYWMVEMELPSTVVLTAGQMVYICVQPSMSFAANGQTGFSGEVGIGNGQECFYAFPLLGNNKWVTATSVFGSPLEAAFVLLGSEGPQLNLLFVDDDAGNAYEVYIEASLANLAYPYDKWVVSDSANVAPTAAQMAAYSGVIWSTAYDYSTTLTPTDTTEIGTYLAGGGCFWLSSQDVLYDIGTVGWMHVGSFTSDIGCASVTGVGPVVNGLAFGTTAGVFTDYSDQCSADGTSWVEFQNETSTDNSIAHEDWGCKFFFNTFAFENINNVADQDSMMKRIIDWFILPPPSHDVGSFAFLSPGTMVSPGSTDVIGVVRNYGSEEDTFDVHCVVTDPTFAIVLDTTINVMTPAGENDTINFGYVDFVNAYTYDLTMATLLATDVNPANDTLTQSTYCTAQYWESFANMPNARSGPYAGWYYDYAGDGATEVHAFGGNPGPSADHYIWDAGTDSWSTGTALPLASCYGGHVTIGDKIYLVGARTGGESSIVIYDVPADAYTTIAIPYGTIGDAACAVYQNKYIYSFGGCQPSGWTATTIVFAYDTEADTFFQPTQLLASDARTCAAAAIIDGVAYIAGGIDETGVYTNELVVGTIDPGDPSVITWSIGDVKPGSAVYRLNGGPVFDDAGNGVFYVAGGDAGGAYVQETYSYTPGVGWATLPNKITGVSNWGCAIAPTDITDDAEWIMYAAGGYSPYQAVFEGFHTGTITGIEEMPNDQVNVFAFTVTCSNPVTDRATFAFSMPFRGAVNFSVFDVTGRKVLDSEYSNISQGEHTMFWNLKDNNGRNVASGTYFYRVEAGDYTADGKLVVVR